MSKVAIMWKEFIEEKVREIRETVSDGKAIIALSGGVVAPQRQ